LNNLEPSIASHSAADTTEALLSLRKMLVSVQNQLRQMEVYDYLMLQHQEQIIQRALDSICRDYPANLSINIVA
jgi:ABC-type cobalamin transport system ATPase subunit